MVGADERYYGEVPNTRMKGAGGGGGGDDAEVVNRKEGVGVDCRRGAKSSQR